jgi:hypothetical protein
MAIRLEKASLYLDMSTADGVFGTTRALAQEPSPSNRARSRGMAMGHRWVFAYWWWCCFGDGRGYEG